MTATGKALDIVANAGEGEGLEARRRLVLETACPGVWSASKTDGSWSDAATAGVRVHQRHRVLRVPEAQASYRHRHPGGGEVRAGDVAHARRHVAAPLDPREQAGHVLQG